MHEVEYPNSLLWLLQHDTAIIYGYKAKQRYSESTVVRGRLLNFQALLVYFV